MKIIINKDETYVIDIPSEINAAEFIKLFDRFYKLTKLISFNAIIHKKSQSVMGGINSSLNPDSSLTLAPVSIKRERHKRTWCNSREKALDLMQYVRHGTKEDKERIVNITKTKWKDLSKSFKGIRDRYNIKPEEIGIKEDNTPMNDYVIKSYTGIFDENENEES